MAAPLLDDRSPIDLLAQRLRAGADRALPEPPSPAADPVADADACLEALVDRLVAEHEHDLAWLLLTLLAGAYPTAQDVLGVLRTLDMADRDGVRMYLLDRARLIADTAPDGPRTARLVEGVVVDVDMCARFDFHNGIQRVAREVARRWLPGRGVTLAAWTRDGGAHRALTPAEEDRAARWRETETSALGLTHTLDLGSDATDLLVPWHATVVMLEVPLTDVQGGRLAALARFSGSEVAAVGYDAIPLISADIRPLGEPNGFVKYLATVKYTHRVAGISVSAAEEFAGFGEALAAQGLPGPEVTAVTLPATVPTAPEGFTFREPERPVVVSVGRLEPHKNHAALVHAAERLWAEGVDFALDLIGGPGWHSGPVGDRIERLAADGRPIRWRQGVPDGELWQAIRTASCTAFISLHEGFGLPVAESLACGTPVITTRYGSQGEIAADGGCLVVDPRDDDDVLAALRSMVTDRALRERLRAEAAARTVRGWDDYADDLWAALIGAAA